MLSIHARTKGHLFLTFLLLSGLIVWGTIFLVFYEANRHLSAQLVESAKGEVNAKEALLRHHIEDMIVMTRAIASSGEFTEKLTAKNFSAARDFLFTLTKTQPEIMQMRFLSYTGQEIIRIERSLADGQPFVVPQKSLQDKSDRYYVHALQQTENGAVWVSPIDLNQEQGRVVIPIQPTVRVGTPVRLTREIGGYLVINLFISEMLEAATTSSNYIYYLLDQNGNFLIHPDPEYAWSKDMDHPSVHKTPLGKFFNAMLQSGSALSDQYYGKQINLFQDDPLYVIAEVNPLLQDTERTDLLFTFLFVALIILLAALPLAYWFAGHVKETDSHLHGIINSMGEGVLVIDSHHRTVIANPAAEAILGYTPDELKSISVYTLFGPIIARPGSRESVIVGKHNRRIPVDSVTAPITLKGNFKGFVTVFKDISSRRKMEEALAEKTRQIKEERDLFISGAVTIFKWKNAPGWPVEYVSGNVQALMGVTPEEFLEGRETFAAMVHPDDVARVSQEVAENSREGKAHFIHKPYRIRHKDGSIRWIYDSTKILRNQQGEITFYFGYLIDITEQKNQEQAYNRLNEELNLIFGLSQNPIAITDLESNFLQVNPAYAHLTGYSTEELKKLSVASLLDTESQGRFTTLLQDVTTMGSISQCKERFLTKAGQGVPMSLSVSLLPSRDKLLFIATDISEETALTLQLQQRIDEEVTKRMENEKIFHAIFDYAGIGIDVTTITGDILENNPKLQQMLGYTHEELHDLNIEDITHAEDLTKAAANLRNLVGGGQESFVLEQRYLTKSGGIVWVKATVTSVKNRFGEVQYLITMLDDLTEQKRLEAEKRDKDELLHQQSKMAAMGEMIGAIGHQWSQPLNTISLLVQDIEDAYQYGDLNAAYLDKFVKRSLDQISFMANTIDDFKDFFKPSKTKHLFEVNEAIDTIIEMTDQQYISHRVEIHKSYTAHPTRTLGHPNEFKHVILNILNNARDAIEERRLKANDPDIRGNVYITTQVRHGQVCVTIEDDAGGIPEEVLPTIFNAYISTKGDKGTGIGLSMSKTMIEKNMEGTLTAANGKRGAVFTITLKEAV